MMSRSNNGLVSLFLRLSVGQYLCSVVFVFFKFFLHVLGLATIGFGCLVQRKIDWLIDSNYVYSYSDVAARSSISFDNVVHFQKNDERLVVNVISFSIAVQNRD